MTYALNRPAGTVTVMEGRHGCWHVAYGWSAHEGARMLCGARVDDLTHAYAHVVPAALTERVTCHGCQKSHRYQLLIQRLAVDSEEIS